MDIAYGEEFDEAFLLELDAVEAAAVQHSHARRDITVSAGRASNTFEQHRAAAQKPPNSTVMLEQSRSTGRSLKPATTCHHEAPNIAGLYRWTVGNISVQDDAATEGSAEDRIGQVHTKSVMGISDSARRGNPRGIVQ